MLLSSTLILVSILTYFVPQLAILTSYQSNPEYLYIFIGVLALDTLVAIPFARLRLLNRPWRFAGLKMLNILINIGFLFFFLEVCPYLINKGFHSLTAIYKEEFRIGYVFLANLLASLIIFIPF